MLVLNKKVSKFASEQSGAFNVGSGVGQNRNIDMVIPSSLGVISLKDTFIQLRASIILDPDFDDVVVPYFLVNKNSQDVPVRNVDIIRNCRMSCTNYGPLEDIRRVNVLRKNVQEHSEGVSSKLSQGQTLYNLTDSSTLRFASPFIEIHKDDGFNSKIVDAHLRIKMSDLFELGSVDALDLGQLGDIRVHIELEQKDFFQVKSIGTDGSFFPKYTDEEEFQDIVGVQGANVITSSYTYTEKEQVPFYQGQKIAISYNYFDNSADETGAILLTTITNVNIFKTQDPADLTVSTFDVSLTLAQPLENSDNGTGVVGDYSNIVVGLVAPDDDAISDIQYLTCELAVCHYLSPMTPKMGLLEWTTYTTEEYTNGFLDLNKIFELESNCTAVYVMFANNNGLISNFTDHFSYRMRVDNVDMYEYDVEVNKTVEDNNLVAQTNDALYWDALTKLFTQTGKSLKCLAPPFSTATIDSIEEYTNEMNSQITILGTPTQLTPLMKLFQLTIQNKMGTPQTPINNIVLFKNVQKSIQL